jgi:hypothetical protein
MRRAVVTRDPHNMGSKQYKWGKYEQCIIVEESMEYLTNLYLVFVDFEKDFDSILCPIIFLMVMDDVMNKMIL